MDTHTSQLTVDEMADSLTGFEELAIAKHFGDEFSALMQKPTMFLRALVMVHAARDENTKADAAKKTAMEMTLRAVNGYFRDDSDEQPDPASLETPTGKDEALAAQ